MAASLVNSLSSECQKRCSSLHYYLLFGEFVSPGTDSIGTLVCVYLCVYSHMRCSPLLLLLGMIIYCVLYYRGSLFDIICSGVSSWTNPLPDIALHTLDKGQCPSCQPLAWKHSESPERIPSKAVILKSRRCHKRVGLNVGGVR